MMDVKSNISVMMMMIILPGQLHCIVITFFALEVEFIYIP
jgi:hypothetical protein